MFDAYRTWLGISNQQRPLPPHELLGVRANERDPHVLEEAALRRTEQIRRYQMKFPIEANQLLSEVATALNLLLDQPPRIGIPEGETYRGKRNKVKLMLLCDGDLDGHGANVTVWQIQLRQVKLDTGKQRRLSRLFSNSRTPTKNTVRTRILAKTGECVSDDGLRVLLRKGLSAARSIARKVG